MTDTIFPILQRIVSDSNYKVYYEIEWMGFRERIKRVTLEGITLSIFWTIRDRGNLNEYKAEMMPAIYSYENLKVWHEGEEIPFEVWSNE